MISQDDLAAIVLRELQDALGEDGDSLAVKRQTALKYYHGELPEVPKQTDPDTGETYQTGNGIVSLDVKDSVHSLLSQIQGIVKTTSVDFEPENQQDEPQAQAESDLIKRLFERNSGFNTLYDALHDALLIGNGWLRLDLCKEEEVTQRNYDAMDPMVAELLAVPDSESQDREVEIDADDGTVSVFITNEVERLKISAIRPENMVYSDNSNIYNVQDLRFCAERRLMTVAELVKLGVDRKKIDNISDANSDEYYHAARAGKYEDSTDTLAVQDAERLKEIYICYLRVDRSETGYKSDLREIWTSETGRQILFDEPANYIPYISGSMIPMPHRIQGQGVFEILKNIQDGKTYILRQYLDNLQVMNQSRVAAVEGKVNLNDLVNGEANGVVRVRDVGAISPLPASDIGQQAISGLNYFDQIKTQRIGSSVDFNEAQNQLMQSSTVAAMGQLAKVEQMAGFFAENLINTLIKPAFVMCHKVLREESTQTISAKLRGRWIEMNPAEWVERKNVEITLGMTTTERAEKINSLNQLMAHQAQLISSGAQGIMIDLQRHYNAVGDWVRASQLGDPSEFYIDPTSEEAQAAGQQQAQAAQQQQQALVQIQTMLEEQRQAFELQKQKNDLEFKYWAKDTDVAVEEAKLQTEIETSEN